MVLRVNLFVVEKFLVWWICKEFYRYKEDLYKFLIIRRVRFEDLMCNMLIIVVSVENKEIKLFKVGKK